MKLPDNIPDLHPIQRPRGRPTESPMIPKEVALAAYEVYCHYCGPQDALITGGCRGGFGTSELIAFLHAKTFPKEQWRAKVDEVLSGLKNF